MNAQITSPEAAEKVLKKLQRAERKHGFNKDRAKKIVQFQNILGDLLEKQPAKDKSAPKIVSTGGNNCRSTSVSGIRHFKSWLSTIKK